MAQQYAPPGQYAQPAPGQPQQPVYTTPPPPVHHISPAPVPQPSYAPHPAPQGGAAGPVEWSNSFWDCCSPSELCCMAYWCPCVVFGKNVHRLKEPSLATYSPVNLHCVGWCGLTYCGFFWVLQMLQRSDVRAKYNLAGSGLGDCCRPYCCPCCELMQEEKELILRTNSASQQAAGYQKPEGGMNYTPQPGH